MRYRRTAVQLCSRSILLCKSTLHCHVPSGSYRIRRMTQIRSVALSSFNLSKSREPSNSKSSTARHVARSPKKPFQSRSRCAGPSARRMDSPPKRLRAGSIGDDVIVVEDPSAMAEVLPEPYRNGVMDERETEVGRDEKALDHKRVLRLFRVDHKRLA